MHNERLAVTQTVTLGLVELEKQIDIAFAQIAKLQVETIQGCRAAHLPLDAGEAGLDKLAEAQRMILSVRAQVNAAHYAFRQDRKANRLPVVSYGDHGDTPPPSFLPNPKGEAAPLKLVDAA